jgi:hypothetical protein
MPVPTRLAETPTKEAIQQVLGLLPTQGLKRWWILENGRSLLGLDCVRAYVPKNATEEDYADALRSYLETAVERVESPQNRSILEIVLGLGDDRWNSADWRGKSASERRAEAGRLFRGDEGMVKGGTIRQIYEPRAIEELAAVVWHDENEARGSEE